MTIGQPKTQRGAQLSLLIRAPPDGLHPVLTMVLSDHPADEVPLQPDDGAFVGGLDEPAEKPVLEMLLTTVRVLDRRHPTAKVVAILDKGFSGNGSFSSGLIPTMAPLARESRPAPTAGAGIPSRASRWRGNPVPRLPLARESRPAPTAGAGIPSRAYNGSACIGHRT